MFDCFKPDYLGQAGSAWLLPLSSNHELSSHHELSGLAAALLLHDQPFYAYVCLAGPQLYDFVLSSLPLATGDIRPTACLPGCVVYGVRIEGSDLGQGCLTFRVAVQALVKGYVAPTSSAATEWKLLLTLTLARLQADSSAVPKVPILDR